MRRSLRSPLWRVPLAREVDEELALHLELLTREFVARGMDPAAAREAARRRMGDLAGLRRTCMDLGRRREREMRLTRWIDEMRFDVRFALRQLRRAPAFTLVAAATLALGIGANGAIFALVDATLLRPLPFPDAERLVAVWETSEADARDGASPVNLADWNARSRAFERLGGYFSNVGGMVMAGADGTAETVPRQWVTAGVFDALGVRPVAGRTFLPEDERLQADVVVLNEDFWRAHFGGDPAVVGSDLRLDGEPYTVVGVVPQQSEVLGRTSMWALATFDPNPGLRGAHFLAVVGRLKPDVTLEEASADLSAVAGGLAREFPETNAGRGVTLEPFRDAVIGGDLRSTSLLFVGVVGFVLLICCANVANLLMARATVRTSELAMRSALGAGRPRVVRQLLTESLVLAALGGALGIGIGAAILEVAPSVIPPGLLPASVELSFDLRVVGFCAAAALLVGLLFGLAPAWRAGELTSARAIASGGGRTATAGGGGLREALVAAEVATAVVLVFGAGLLLRTLLAVDGVDRGYRAGSVLTMMVDPLGSSYPTPEALLGFYDDVEREVRALPGVEGAAWATTLPMGDSVVGDFSFEIVGEPLPDEALRPVADLQIVSPTYFPTLVLPVVAGRGIDARDTGESVPVCMVNEALADRHLQGRSPIGRQVALRPASQPQAEAQTCEVVGVARQVKRRPDEREALLQVYVPMAQAPIDDIYLLVTPASGRAEALTGAVRAAIGRIDKEQLVSVRDVTTLDDVAHGATGRHRLRAVLVATFAGLALLLAMVGVFGVLTYSVQQRIRDFAMRRALGATTRDVARSVVAGAARVIVAGAVIGLALSALAGRLLSAMLFGVQPFDPATFLIVLLLLAATAAASVAGPAWRAVRIDPADALRHG
jgi:putative ABC transport system permease protein